MTLKLAIIADDLTGALDTGTPFVEAGLKVAVAIDVEVVAEALRREPDVIVINTASRALSAGAAAQQVQAALVALGTSKPPVLFKKIDSRLKGNVAAESMALAEATGRNRIVVAPAIPDQQRFTVEGAVTGRGVETPLPVRALFPASALTINIYDAGTDADLDDLVRQTDWPAMIAVGARGLGSAFARSLAKPAAIHPHFPPSTETLFAFGSRDPITSAQIAYLAEHRQLAAIAEAPAGELSAEDICGLPAVARCSGEQISIPEQVVYRFADGIRGVVEQTRPHVLMMGGGDTALAILKALGASVLIPNGEIEAGIPWFQIESADGRTICCAVKSGGFGNVDSLLKLVPENLLSQRPSHRTRIEKQAW
ncbi:four-carbon acid sugar kinase family protein [Pararhizobium sp. YC-54]|uniref:four-carbon acid sugar kinase family protein n=1 Tax=Pararhizobium sp. YC-54 TaxID=2986920 RepID=UPI0021F6F87D|nr:four-carbon acid sugar kinase family protein [Pararhizobium sp. YC-54]MCV9998849.1 four-carbon acid sugar kinase family protein [Pararhizobium sp. YC-54]